MPSIDFASVASDIVSNSSGAVTAGLVIFGFCMAIVVGKKVFKSAAK